MAPSNPQQTPHGGASSQAGLAAWRAAVHPIPHTTQTEALLAMIDAYASARVERDHLYRQRVGDECATAHRELLAVRNSILLALGIPPGSTPMPGDPMSLSTDSVVAGGAL